jgi:hypothetical protein
MTRSEETIAHSDTAAHAARRIATEVIDEEPSVEVGDEGDVFAERQRELRPDTGVDETRLWHRVAIDVDLTFDGEP